MYALDDGEDRSAGPGETADKTILPESSAVGEPRNSMSSDVLFGGRMSWSLSPAPTSLLSLSFHKFFTFT